MKEVSYNGSLIEDIEKCKSKKGTIIAGKVISTLIALGISYPIIIWLTHLLGGAVNWIFMNTYLIGINTFSCIRQIRKEFKENEKLVDKKKKKVKHLSKDILEIFEEDNSQNNRVNYIGEDTILNAVTTKEVIKEEDDDQVVKSIIRDFYFLDSKDQLRVLREVSKNIKSKKNKYKDEETNLYLLEDDDIPEELPVVRRLERKE